MLVVGSATLAILLVCFSMYQSAQMSNPADADVSKPKTPRPRMEKAAAALASDQTPSADLGTAKIGKGERVRLRIWDPQGSEPRFEIDVLDWTPVPGTDDEFRLVDPIIRMRTKDNHAVRVSAKEGTLEAKKRSSEGIDPQRGKLTGDVVIEYDRLTIPQRNALPPDQRNVIDPAQVVRIETAEIEFDLEYAKVVMPGSLKLRARDVNVDAANLELRFNEAQNRVESLRINGGGSIELLESVGSVAMNAQEPAGPSRRTVVEWLRETIQSRLTAPKRPATPSPTEAAEHKDYGTRGGVPVDADGVPVFRPKDLREPKKKRELHYFARFEGSIDAAEKSESRIVSRLQSDTLEILRDFSDDDQLTKPAGPKPAGGEAGGSKKAETNPASPSSNRIVVKWADRLVVQALDANDKRLQDRARARVTATGSPARISHPEGDAVCSRLSYEPDPPEVWLYGTDDDPVVVRARGQGVLTGTTVHTREQGDRLFLDVAGPGKLVTLKPAKSQEEATKEAKPDGDVADIRLSDATDVATFGERLQAEGHVRSKTSIDFTGGITTKRYRLLDKATLTGATSIRQDDVLMQADSLELHFGARETWDKLQQQIEGFTGTGHVVMTRDQDRLACRELETTMTTAPDGRVWPERAIAHGDIDAEQDHRLIKAGDKLIVDFELYQEKPKDDQAKSGPDKKPAAAPHAPKWRSGVKRLQAFGDVTFADPAEALEVTADQLDCKLDVAHAQPDLVTVLGKDDRPANVRLDDVTTTGKHINLNVHDELAEVQGAGRMTFRSHRDLDGRPLKSPRPIVVEWNTGMRYEGQKNHAVFGGGVHAYSESSTTFDCDRLEIEFDEAGTTIASAKPKPKERWWLFPETTAKISGSLYAAGFLVDQLLDTAEGYAKKLDKSGKHTSSTRREFNREPSVIRAFGHAQAVSSETDEKTGAMRSRMMIRGPKLAVYLRSEVSKLLMEGAGSLLLEQFEDESKPAASTPEPSGELFDVGSDGEPSKTLIEWNNSMVYDFAIDQTRFEGDVSLKHFSGSELRRRFGGVPAESADRASGRAWFLTCQLLTVDFLQRDERQRQPLSERMGRLSTSSLRQFSAHDKVQFNDPGEGLQVWSDGLVYEQPRKLLAIQGSASRKARIIKRRPGRLPLQMDEDRLFYNLKTGRLEITNIKVR